MCSASHGWVGLGRIVYITSSAQFRAWLREWGVPAAPVAALPISEIVPGAVTDGPVDELAREVEDLYHDCFAQRRPSST